MLDNKYKVAQFPWLKLGATHSIHSDVMLAGFFCDATQISWNMMTSSNGNIFRVTCPLCGEFTGPGEFPAQRPVTLSSMFSLICVWMNDWVNKREADDLIRHRGRFDVTVMVVLLLADILRQSHIASAIQLTAPHCKQVSNQCNYKHLWAAFINSEHIYQRKIFGTNQQWTFLST